MHAGLLQRYYEAKLQQLSDAMQEAWPSATSEGGDEGGQ
jgi:hypothetical protein